MSNEELAVMVQSGDRERLTELWDQVRRLIWKQARRWAVGGRNGVELEDLLQAGFIAAMRAADNFDSSTGAKFTTALDYYLKQEFTAAVGQRTKRSRMDPLQSAVSLDAPLTDDEGDPFTLTDTLPDPAAEAAFENVMEQDRAKRLHDVLEAAIATLSEEQQCATRRRYFTMKPLRPGQTRYSDTTAHAAALRLLRHPSRSRTILRTGEGISQKSADLRT
ncbi:MAG: sigma-70 family RNA polymerase sigma factor [Oscillibacter sp.]|nr:sigma-70 family RNA polymerase sigma factor [Oscillibacter sp.]MBD5155629.1 sigma-70 family RNA polymerase sigma factor [Oscillibacter sp.]